MDINCDDEGLTKQPQNVTQRVRKNIEKAFRGLRGRKKGNVSFLLQANAEIGVEAWH